MSPSISPRLQGFLLGLIGVALFFALVVAGYPEQGKLAGFSFCGIAVAVKIQWEYHARPWFWLTITLVVMIHIIIIFLVPWKEERNPGIMFSPLAILDIFVTIGLLDIARRITK